MIAYICNMFNMINFRKQVLAEYIVVLAQMNKGPEHLSNELGAFFSDKARALTPVEFKRLVQLCLRCCFSC